MGARVIPGCLHACVNYSSSSMSRVMGGNQMIDRVTKPIAGVSGPWLYEVSGLDAPVVSGQGDWEFATGKGIFPAGSWMPRGIQRAQLGHGGKYCWLFYCELERVGHSLVLYLPMQHFEIETCGMQPSQTMAGSGASVGGKIWVNRRCYGIHI